MRVRYLVALMGCAIVTVAPASGQYDDLAAKSQRGKELIAAERFEEAIQIYRELSRALPGDPGPMANLGMVLHLAGHDREAAEKLEAVLKIDPTYLPAQLFLGAARVGSGEPAKAVAPLEKVIRTQPDHIDARRLLGEALLATGRHGTAVPHFEKLRELDPANPKTWSGLGRSYEALAQQDFVELEKVALGSAFWLVLAAEARAKVGHLNGAFYLYRQALEKLPSLRGVHSALAEIYRKTEHPDWAAIEEEKERSLTPLACDDVGKAAPRRRVSARPPQRSGPDARKLECDYWAGRYRELIASAKSAPNPETFYWRSRAYDKLAADAFSRLEALPPSAEVHELMGQIYYGQRRCLDAVKEWKAALEFSSRNPYYRKELAISMTCSRDYEGARQLLQELLKESEDSPELNYWLGTVLIGLKEEGEAVPYLEKAVEADPTVPAPHRELARAYLHSGQAAKAIPHLQFALPFEKDGSLYYQLAQAYRSTGQQDLAKEALRKFQGIQNATVAQKENVEQEMQISAPETK